MQKETTSTREIEYYLGVLKSVSELSDQIWQGTQELEFPEPCLGLPVMPCQTVPVSHQDL